MLFIVNKLIKMVQSTHTLLLLIFNCLILVSPAVNANDDVMVLYPIVREPYASVYRDMLRGVEQGYDGKVDAFGLNGDLSAESLGQYSDNGRAALVALGNKAYESAVALSIGTPLFAAVTKSVSSRNLSGGILLEAGAEVYLSRLLEIHPDTSKVHLVYHPERQAALTKEAEQFLTSHNVNFDFRPAINIRESALAFRDLVKNAGKGDAVWLISDPRLIDSSLLSLVLDAAWDKHLLVFSSNPVFVKRGALFAIYPDNTGIGIRLGAMVTDTLQGRRAPGHLDSLTDVKVAYNERTGNHIGIDLNPNIRQGVELFLPER